MNTHQNNIDLAFATLNSNLYVNPSSAKDFSDAFSPSLDQATCFALLDEAIKRIAVLERALTPFAVHGGTMLHLRRLLDEAGRGTEPAGGVWFNADQGVAPLPKEKEFFAAIDALGRTKTRRVIAQDIARHDAARDVDVERDKY